MAGLLGKISGNIKRIKEAYKADKCFSKELAKFRRRSTVYGRLRLHNLSNKYRDKTDQWILGYLRNALEEVIGKYQNDDNIGEYDPSAPIWVCWWTGEETAPDLVKQCIKSIRANCGSHTVNIVTKYNYNEYIDIPDYIIDKVESGDMCIANFSDYLRASLISEYGGLWLDATIFCSRTIPEDYFKSSFFTLKSEPVECGYISKCRWTSFCIGGYKGHTFFKFFREAFDKYWQNEQKAIDYLLVDYVIETAYENLPIVKECFDILSCNNPHRDDLQAAFNAKLPAEDFASVITDDTVLYKLSWREKYSEVTSDGKKSIYGYFLEMEI